MSFSDVIQKRQNTDPESLKSSYSHTATSGKEITHILFIMILLNHYFI